MQYAIHLFISTHFQFKSGRGAVDSVLVLQSWGCWFDPPLLQSFRGDFKPRSRLHDLVVSETLNLKSPLHTISSYDRVLLFRKESCNWAKL